MQNPSRLDLRQNREDLTTSGHQIWASPQLIGRGLALSDVIGMLLCFHVASWIRVGQHLDPFNPGPYVIVMGLLLALYLGDTYDTSHHISGLWAPARVILVTMLCGAATASLVYLFGLWGTGPLYGRSILLSAFLAFTGWAVSTRRLATRIQHAQANQTSWLVLGNSRTAKHVQKLLGRHYPNAAVTYVSASSKQLSQANSRDDKQTIEFSGHYAESGEWQTKQWSGVLLGNPNQLPADLVRELMQLRLRGTPIYSVAEFQEEFLFRVPTTFLHDDWFVFAPGFGLVHRRINFRIKRWVDIVASTFLLLALSPVMLLTALAIKLDSRGPIFYNQIRTGLNREPFRIFKFRSMRTDAEKDGAKWAQKNDTRVTRVGKWIRLTRLDELPQLWNVLRGDMTLVGPRPERPEFDGKLSQHIPYYDLRYLVKPGLTGWAQVMYSYGASIDDARAKFEYDLYYIKNYSLLLDLAIALKTLRVVLFGKGR